MDPLLTRSAVREVLIDITRLLGRAMKGRLATGVDRVSIAYVRHFRGRARALVRYGGRTLVLPPSASRELFDRVLNPPDNFSWNVKRLVGKEFFNVTSGRNMKGAFLFNTGHSALEKPAYPGQVRRMGVRPLFLVHDLIPIAYPEYSRPGEMEHHVVRIRNVLELATGVITNSQQTLDELQRYAEETGRSMPPAVAALLAPPDLPAPSETRPIQEPYFLVIGTIEPRKNHWLLLQIWRRLAERMGSRTPRLVVVGQRGWECENVVDLLERCSSLKGIVTELSACSDADLATYLKHSIALLFPSFAEGYGLPLVEALSVGVPVIASDLPVFREIGDDIPDYLDPLDGMAWLAHIEAFAMPASPERAAQLGRLAKFVQPNWSTHFNLVEGLMERLG